MLFSPDVMNNTGLEFNVRRCSSFLRRYPTLRHTFDSADVTLVIFVGESIFHKKASGMYSFSHRVLVFSPALTSDLAHAHPNVTGEPTSEKTTNYEQRSPVNRHSIISYAKLYSTTSIFFRLRSWIQLWPWIGGGGPSGSLSFRAFLANMALVSLGYFNEMLIWGSPAVSRTMKYTHKQGREWKVAVWLISVFG